LIARATVTLSAVEASWYAAEAAMATLSGFAFGKEYDIEHKWRESPPLPDRTDFE